MSGRSSRDGCGAVAMKTQVTFNESPQGDFSQHYTTIIAIALFTAQLRRIFNLSQGMNIASHKVRTEF